MLAVDIYNFRNTTLVSLLYVVIFLNLHRHGWFDKYLSYNICCNLYKYKKKRCSTMCTKVKKAHENGVLSPISFDMRTGKGYVEMLMILRVTWHYKKSKMSILIDNWHKVGMIWKIAYGPILRYLLWVFWFVLLVYMTIFLGLILISTLSCKCRKCLLF